MSNHPHGVPPVADHSKRASTAMKLLQAVALAALLVALGPVAVEAETIRCVTTTYEGGCEAFGSYSEGTGSQSNVWEFYSDWGFSDLIYTFQIEGTPTSDFSLDVSDFVTTQSDLVTNGFMSNFSTLTCVSTYGPGECGLFDVFEVVGAGSWDDGYQVTIRWFSNADPLSQPPAGSFVTILQARDGTDGVFGNTLQDIWYDPLPVPVPSPPPCPYESCDVDPAIGGRGDSFSRFGVFTAVPEPSSLILLGTGLAGALYGARRRKRQP